jgi:Flp pilus assembly protein protease CpaA
MLSENLFLIILAVIWIVIAVIQDLRKREVANWWNFSLIAVALSYRAFLSLWKLNYLYIVYGIVGFGIFFIVANLFYYSRVFAGGDAKLLMALGAVLSFSNVFMSNIKIFIIFIFGLLFFGSFYALVYSFVIVVRRWKDFKKEFLKQLKNNEKIMNICFIIAVALSILFLFLNLKIMLAFPMIILIFPILFSYAKSIEEACMVKSVDVKNLVIGDWLYKEVKVKHKGKKKIIKPNWDGLSEHDIKILEESGRKKVKVKEGIPFTPSFLFAFLFLIISI